MIGLVSKMQRGYLESNFNHAVIDEISNIHEILYIYQVIIFKRIILTFLD